MNNSLVSANQNEEIDSINSYFECITEAVLWMVIKNALLVV